MKVKILIILVLITKIISAQSNCMRFDTKSGLAYNISDSNLYTGICKKYYKNDKIQSFCQIDSGKFKLTMYWDEKGNLIDSSVFIDGVDKYRSYQYMKGGKINSICTYYLSRKENDTIRYFDYSEAIFYYKNDTN